MTKIDCWNKTKKYCHYYPMNNSGKYGDNFIKFYREKKGLSTRKLANKIGTFNQTISNLELGKQELTWSWMQKLADALDCEPFNIVNGPSDDELRSEILTLMDSMAEDDQKRLKQIAEAFVTPKALKNDDT